ncbi:MAG: tRNA guanosine(34) transglycosylase Tgt [Planctomycetota bacterium]
MSAPCFELLRGEDPGRPRRGRYQTAHGSFETPCFAPCGTRGAIKGLLPAQVREAGVELILCNTYHLALRPGAELVEEAGGLHQFIGWPGPILSDSGGYQVFSLEGKREVTDEGVRFAGAESGKALFLDPAEALHIQRALGSDIAMVLDECPPAGATPGRLLTAHRRTLAWARRSREIHARHGGAERGQALFGILQGGSDPGLRREAAAELALLDFDGYAIGGVSVGESKGEIYETVRQTTPFLPAERIHYLMGVGEPGDLFECALSGIDLFDCVTPTRHGRNHQVFVPEGTLRLKHAAHTRAHVPLQEGCPCPCCTGFTRAYLRHLALSNEMLAAILLSLHNLRFLETLMQELRARIAEDHGEGALRGWFAEAYPGWAGRVGET